MRSARPAPSFGLRVPVHAIPMFTFEPYYAKSKYKDRDETIGGITYTRGDSTEKPTG